MTSESAILFLLQINMSHDDVSRVKLELIPMIQETLTEWHIIHFFGTTPSESPPIEDFSYKLSSLQIGRMCQLDVFTLLLHLPPYTYD